jgi:ATP-binding cassette, subfamily F, member 3
MLTVHNISKSFGINQVLLNISFTLNSGEKAALVGPNGVGKTTLLRILTGTEKPDRGSVQFNPPDLSLGYLPQGGNFTNGETFGDFIRRSQGDLPALTARLESLASSIVNSSDPGLQTEYDKVLGQIKDLTDIAGKVPSIIASLGLVNIPSHLQLSSLSGGQKTRLGLAGILLTNPRLLLLDEPTNHLDFEMLDWLENWLTNSRFTVLFVSHDRTFLDRVAGTILEIDPSTHELKVYPGNYSAYLEQKEFERQKHWQEYSDQQTQIKQLTNAARHIRGIAKFKKGGKADTGDKFAKAFFANRSLATVKRAKNIEERVEKLLTEDHVEKPRSTWQMKMSFPTTHESGRNVLVLDHLSIGYGETAILSNLNAVLQYGERAALIGPNGCGKTTLLRTAAGLLPPITGKCRLGASVKCGHITQEQEEFLPDLNAVTTLQHDASLNENDARTYLHKYLFTGDEVFTEVRNLSYGQRSRLALACLVAQGCNFLLLDEPLNHLDLPSRAQFEQALADFEGTILTAVHDRYFIERYATRLWLIKNGVLCDSTP